MTGYSGVSITTILTLIITPTLNLTLTLLFSCFDDDNNGYIDLREFILGLTNVWKGSVADKAVVYFSAVDYDNNGMVDHKEVHTMLMDSKAFPGGDNEIRPLVQALFRCLDPNRSGQISVEEFHVGFQEHAHIVAPIFDRAFYNDKVVKNEIENQAARRAAQGGPEKSIAAMVAAERRAASRDPAMFS